MKESNTENRTKGRRKSAETGGALSGCLPFVAACGICVHIGSLAPESRVAQVSGTARQSRGNHIHRRELQIPFDFAQGRLSATLLMNKRFRLQVFCSSGTEG